MTSLGAFRVTASDISAGKSKAWTSIKERIATLIREHDRLSAKNLHFQGESHASVRSLESDHLMAESNNGPQVRRPKFFGSVMFFGLFLFLQRLKQGEWVS